MAIQLSVAARNARLQALVDQIGAAARIEIRSGTRPANVATAATGTLLAELTGGSPFAPAPSGGVATANAITQDASANNTGTASWARILTSGSVAVMDIDVTATGGGGELQLVTTSIVATQPVQITSFTLTEGNP